MPRRPQAPSSAPRCLITLDPMTAEGFSDKGLRELAGGRGGMPTRLTFSRADVITYRNEHMKRMSISGMQDKISLKLNRAHLTVVDKEGTHILKPIPSTQFHLVNDLPANEHATMLIAKQLGIQTAACGLIRMADEELAYITRRFDRQANGQRLFQEDFGALAQISADTNGKNWKYNYSYEGIGKLIAIHNFARARDLQEFYKRIVFCFLIGNGDAHVRNFSVLRDATGSVALAPAYDLLCTRLHMPSESDLALSLLANEADGVFSPTYNNLGYYSRSDFIAFGEALGINKDSAIGISEALTSMATMKIIEEMVGRSFLSEGGKVGYRRIVKERREKYFSG